VKKPTEEQIIKDVRRAYLLAKALNFQYQFIREYVNTDLYKAISSAKGTNSFFIKQIDLAFGKHRLKSQLEKDEELAFRLLEELEKQDVSNENTPAGETQ
jgi:hypothetical protein